MKLPDLLELLMIRYTQYQVNIRIIRDQSNNELYLQLYRDTGLNQAFSIIVSVSDTIKWTSGAPCSQVFPFFNEDQRDFLKTGIIPEEQDNNTEKTQIIQGKNGNAYLVGYANKKGAYPGDCCPMTLFTTEVIALNEAFQYISKNNGVLMKVENSSKGGLTFKRLTYIQNERTYSITISPLELRGK